MDGGKRQKAQTMTRMKPTKPRRMSLESSGTEYSNASATSLGSNSEKVKKLDAKFKKLNIKKKS